MANVAGICNTFKRDVLNGHFAFGTAVIRAGTAADTFNVALFASTASRSKSDTVYNTTGELAASGNYTQGGQAVTNATPPALDGDTAHWTPSANVSWPNFTSSAAFDCAVLYNDTSGTNQEVAVFTFSEQSVTAGTFTLQMPTNNGTTGLLRLA